MSISLNLESTEPHKAPTAIEPWLSYDKPLTDKLRELSGDAEIELLSQGWIFSKWWDKYALDLKEKLFQREIFMKSQGEICWYARTIIPSSTYALEPTFFNRLENESIRNLIFNEPKVKITKRIIYPIDELAIEFHWVKKYLTTINGDFWVRLAEFSFQNKNSFYLMEILFPKLQEFEL